MKSIYLLAVSILLTIIVNSQPVTIGTGSLTTSNSPYNSYFSYSYTQTIYSKNEIGATGNISSISFNFAGTSLSNSDSITIYMGVVNNETFFSANDWVPLSSLTQVYKNQLTGYVVPGMITINLPVPFAYNGSGNLVIAVDENKPNRNSTIRYTGTSIPFSNQVLYYADNTINPNPAAPPAGILSNVIGNITINGLTISPCKNTISNVAINKTSVTGTTAVAKWRKPVVGGQSPSQYAWEVREEGYDPTDGTSGLISSGTTVDTTVNLSSLNTFTLYTFFVKPLCGVADFNNWSTGTDFQTDCDAVNIPYYEDFSISVNGNLPNCMSVESLEPLYYEWYVSGGEARVGFYEPYYYSQLYTPGLNLVAGTAYRLKFKSVFSGSTSVNEFRVYLSGPSGGLLFSNSDASFNPNDSNYTVDFLPTVTGKYKISFTGDSYSYYYSCTVDDISVTESPACIEPKLIPATGISTNSATISWKSPVRPTINYDIYISSNVTPPSASTLPSYPAISNTSLVLSNLSPNTKYYYWVRSNCGNNSYSGWSMSKNFTTLCQPTNLPYAIDFEASANLPECTNTIGYNEGSWRVDSDITGQSLRLLKFDFNYIDDNIIPRAWFYSRGIYLTAGATYNLTFRYSTDAFYDAEIGAYYGSSYAAMNNALAYYTIIDVDGENISNTNFTPTTSGVYYLGFLAKSDPMNPWGVGAVYLDDIYVTQVAPCMEPKSILASNITQNSAKIDWSIQSAAATSYELYYSTNNVTPAISATPNQSGLMSTTANLSGLLQNTKYYVWVRSNCGGQGKSVWSISATFTTLEVAGITSITAAKNPICAFSYTTLTANGVKGTNAVVTWWTGPGGTGSNLGTGLTLANQGAGTYYARVIASVGSPVEAMYILTFYPGTGVSQTNVNICNNYTWNGVTYRQSGTYTFKTTTAFGCDSVATLKLTILSVASTFTKTDAGCYGSATGSITVTATSGTGPYTYRLGTSGTYSSVNTFTNLKAGSYRVSIIDATGCSGLTNSIIVSQSPAISATVAQTNIICYGAATGSFTLTGTNGTAPYTYRLGTTGSYTSTNTFINLKAGSYRVYILDAKGCISNIVITLTQPSAALSLATSKTDIICRGAATGVIAATATGGTAPYTFKLGVNGNYASAGTFAGLVAGTYTVYLKDSKGCTTTSTIVILQPVSAVAGTITKADVKCYGMATGSIFLLATGGTPPYQYKIGTSSTYSSVNNFTGLKAGTYNAFVKDSVGCIFSTSTVVAQPSAISATYTKNDERCPGAKDGTIVVNGVGGTPPYAYRLGTTGAFSTNNNFTGLKAGSYRVYVSDANNCGNYSVAIIITQKSTTCIAKSAIAKTDSPGRVKLGGIELHITPNPSASIFSLQVRTPIDDKLTIRVLNVDGKTVYTSIVSPKQIIRFGETLNAGVYFIEVRQGLEMKTVKAIKIK